MCMLERMSTGGRGAGVELRREVEDGGWRKGEGRMSGGVGWSAAVDINL